MEEQAFERDVFCRITRILSDFSAQLTAVGLEPVVGDIKRWGEKERYQSEITIDFFDRGNLVDVIEFFVYEDGAPVASKDQFETWFKEVLQDVLARRVSQG